MPSNAAGESLTGDWNGRRSSLADAGVEPGLALYADAFAVVDGGLERDTYFPVLIEPTLGLDLGKLAGWDDTRAFIRGIGMLGGDPVEGTGSLNAPSNLANPVQTFRLYEAWVERRVMEQRLSVLLGLYAVDTEFDVTETAAVFVNGGFGTGVDLSQSGANGPCVYPTGCVGARLKYLPTARTYIQVAVLNGAAGDPDDPHGTDFVFDHDAYGTLTVAEFGYRRDAADEGDRFLRAALGAWYYSAEFDDVAAVDAAGNPRHRHTRPGFYALLEGGLYREPGRPTEGLSGFVRVGFADPNVHEVASHLNLGLVRTGLLPHRGEDVTAFGASVPFNGSRFKDAQRAAGTPVDDFEAALELTHQLQLAPWLALQVGAQYFVNPGTDPAVGDALVFNVRCQVVL